MAEQEAPGNGGTETGRHFSLEKIYDVIAFRMVIEGGKEGVYAALGIVHDLWRPVPGRFKDYVALPKSNGHQSLHTTVIGPYGERMEMQIRTAAMHRQAELGIAAHWKYKEGRITEESGEEGFAWLRQLLEWQQHLSDPNEFLETVRVDLFPDGDPKWCGHTAGTRTALALSVSGGPITRAEKAKLGETLISGVAADLSSRDLTLGNVKILWLHFETCEDLLVHAAAGGVGIAAVQVGKALGARVIATAGGAEKLEVARDKEQDDSALGNAYDVFRSLDRATLERSKRRREVAEAKQKSYRADARASGRPFMMHWTQRISTAAVRGNARRALNAIRALEFRHS